MLRAWLLGGDRLGSGHWTRLPGLRQAQRCLGSSRGTQCPYPITNHRGWPTHSRTYRLASYLPDQQPIGFTNHWSRVRIVTVVSWMLDSDPPSLPPIFALSGGCSSMSILISTARELSRQRWGSRSGRASSSTTTRTNQWGQYTTSAMTVSSELRL